LLFFLQTEDGIRYATVTGVQTCALPIWASSDRSSSHRPPDIGDASRRGAEARHRCVGPAATGGRVGAEDEIGLAEHIAAARVTQIGRAGVGEEVSYRWGACVWNKQRTSK